MVSGLKSFEAIIEPVESSVQGREVFFSDIESPTAPEMAQAACRAALPDGGVEGVGISCALMAFTRDAEGSGARLR